MDRDRRRAVGLLGGTFDPPHVAHLVVARQVGHLLGLDEVRLLVAGDPWQKGDESPASVRVELVRAAIDGDPRLGIELVEVDREGPTHTVETLESLRMREPDVDWHFIAGADTVAGMPTWDRAVELPRLATLVGVDRGGVARPTGWPSEHVTWIDGVPNLDVASSTIRRMVADGWPVDGLVPPSVLRRIQAMRLYRPADGC